MNREDFERIAAEDPLSYLQANFANHVVGLEKAKKALILTLASGDDTRKERRRIHTILFGPPGTAKTLLLHAVAREGDSIVLGPRASTGGLTIDFRSGNVGIIGQIHDTPSQLLALDEMEKLENSTLDQLLVAMETGAIRYAGGGSTDVIPAHVRMVAAVNNMDKLSRELVDRFDYAVNVPSPNRLQAHQVVKGITENFLADKKEAPAEPETYVVREYLEHARRVHPEFDEGERRLTQSIFRVLVNSEPENRIRLRRFPGILRTAYAIARLRNSNVTAYHVLEAINVQHPNWQPIQLYELRRLMDFRAQHQAVLRARAPPLVQPAPVPPPALPAETKERPEATMHGPPPRRFDALGDPDDPANAGTGLE